MTSQTTQPIQSSLNPISYNHHTHKGPSYPQANYHLPDLDRSLTLESQFVDLKSPIPEEDEDETGGEAANIPSTHTENDGLHNCRHGMNDIIKQDEGSSPFSPVMDPAPPAIVKIRATPTLSASEKDSKQTIRECLPRTPVQKRPGLSIKDAGVGRAVTGFFNRSVSHDAHHEIVPLAQSNANLLSSGLDIALSREQRRATIKRRSATNLALNTRISTPASPEKPADIDTPYFRTCLQDQEVTPHENLDKGKKGRSSTGFHIRDKLLIPRIHFPHHQKEGQCNLQHPSTISVDFDSACPDPQHPSNGKLPERAIWALPAETGIGLKSRRLSLSLPDDFNVDVVELYSEYSEQSLLIGLRGKTLGKGATSKVRLMSRKGYSEELYAVKEFRGKSSSEKVEEHEKKLKSEYSIAKSLHHPNIVETIRLCTHNGRWNHVMEYCDQGDLFHLVGQKYLSKEEHRSDRLCLFKQLIQGLNYLHRNGIAHRDIKLENLLITKDSKLKITDFGVSEVFAGIHPGLRAAGGQCGKEMGEVRLCAPGMCGSLPYVAPEVLEKKGTNL